jgi:RNA polymerase sigma-70 factor, ECF subfamily
VSPAAAAPTAPTTGHTLDPDCLGDHFDRLYRAALGLCGSPHAAEDLVQDTYLRVLKRPRIVRNDDNLGYLLRTLRNVYCSSLRTASRRPRATDAEIDLDGFAARATAAPDEAAEHRETLAAVAALDPPFRDAVVAVDVAGLTCREAADVLGVAPGTVMSRLFRARRKLADDQGVTLTPVTA